MAGGKNNTKNTETTLLLQTTTAEGRGWSEYLAVVGVHSSIDLAQHAASFAIGLACAYVAASSDLDGISDHGYTFGGGVAAAEAVATVVRRMVPNNVTDCVAGMFARGPQADEEQGQADNDAFKAAADIVASSSPTPTSST